MVVERNLTTESSKYKEAIKRNTCIGGEGSLLGALGKVSTPMRTLDLLDCFLQKYDLDALVLPTVYSWRIAALAGHPCITVPAGSTSLYEEFSPNRRGTFNISGPNKAYGYVLSLDQYMSNTAL